VGIVRPVDAGSLPFGQVRVTPLPFMIEMDDGVCLYAEATEPTGPDLLFLHELCGDHRSWETQVGYFRRNYRCITFAARGYLPSDVPPAVSSYSQDRAVADAVGVLDHFHSTRANVVGLSMGGFTALNLLLDHPQRVSAAVVAGAGYGSGGDAAQFVSEALAVSEVIRQQGSEHFARLSADSAYRHALKVKDPRGFEQWRRELAEHDAIGLANTIAGVQATRPTMPRLASRLSLSTVPVLLVVGDEDDPCLEANLDAKRRSPQAGLTILPKTGHTVNLEEPAAFNQATADFLSRVEHGQWHSRDPRSQPESGGWIR
jgi:pimeloyl-ACP methyl ester carboxylesterase